MNKLNGLANTNKKQHPRRSQRNGYKSDRDGKEQYITGKNEKEKKIKEIEHLNHLLKESRILNEEFLQNKGERTSMDDVRALSLYIQLQQAPILFNPDTDLLILKHWLNIAANGFAQTLTTKYPI